MVNVLFLWWYVLLTLPVCYFTGITKTADYMRYYPGDNYVDVVGFDLYYTNNHGSPTINSFAQLTQLVTDFAHAHNKLSAITEVGF